MSRNLQIRISSARYWIISILEYIVVPTFLLASLYLIGFVVIKSNGWFRLATTLSDPSARITAENLIMTTLAQILGGAFVLVGVYFTAKSVFVTREGNITDRL